MSGWHMSPWVDFNRRGGRRRCVTASRNLFSLRVNPPPPPPALWHSHFFACEAAWMPEPGVGFKTEREVSQEETAVPRVYPSTPACDPLHHLSFPSQAAHTGQTSLLMCAFECDSVGPNTRGGFPLFAVDLGLRRGERKSTTLTSKVLFFSLETFSARCQERAMVVVSVPVHSAYDGDWRSSS